MDDAAAATSGQLCEKVDIDAKLRQFEKLVDKNDPEQMKILEEMKEHTRRLHQARGDWNKPNTFRNWNEIDPSNRKIVKPLENKSYRDYKNHLIRENHPLELIAKNIEPKLLMPGEPSQNSTAVEPRKSLLTNQK